VIRVNSRFKSKKPCRRSPNTNPLLHEGRQGHEATNIILHQISKQAWLLPLITNSQRLFALLCGLGVKNAVVRVFELKA
jgi:hypothetical protein